MPRKVSCKAVLLDIEGTTTSISFVKDTLFPYVRCHVTEYVDVHWEEEELMSIIQGLKEQAESDERSGMANVASIPSLDSPKDELMKAVITNVLWQMDADRKTTALKRLQGCIWRDAYYGGKMQGHIYNDVLPAIQSWRNRGLQIFIYSSGSIEAQRLLFQHTIFGDLLPLIDNHFDTNIGPKVEIESYTRIANQVNLKPEEILFLTDVVKEAAAAEKAGFQVCIVARDGNVPLNSEDKSKYWQIHAFDEIIVS